MLQMLDENKMSYNSLFYLGDLEGKARLELLNRYHRFRSYLACT
jgi:hypothetical protein